MLEDMKQGEILKLKSVSRNLESIGGGLKEVVSHNYWIVMKMLIVMKACEPGKMEWVQCVKCGGAQSILVPHLLL